ncbi:hypothetical protein AB0O91_08670 [Kitasatospora sp. NPDC089797]
MTLGRSTTARVGRVVDTERFTTARVGRVVTLERSRTASRAAL